MATFSDRLRTGWNAFRSLDDPSSREDNPFAQLSSIGGGVSIRPDRPRPRFANERTIISSVYTRMSIDCATIVLRHTKHDDTDRYLEDIKSGLDDCLTVEANVDQSGRHFRQDIFWTLFNQGTIAIVPVDTTLNPSLTGGYDIQTLRVGTIVDWMPYHVRVDIYDERKAIRRQVVLEKKFVGIVENPFYATMNEPNSTMQRLMRKLALLDSVDEASSSGKLDLIIQLPYVVKSETRKQQANQRREAMEEQLVGSKYGIAYADATEKITQLNRPAENNLLNQIETLTNQLYTQLGLTAEVMNGTADEAAMLNYVNRTVEPIVGAVVDEMRRKFLTKTARTQGQSIDYFRDPFKLIPMSTLADISDKLSRNEIVSANEFRQVIGMKPSKDPKADQLINSNMPVADTGVAVPGEPDPNADPNAAPADAVQTEPVPTEMDTAPLDDINDSLTQALTDAGITGASPVVLAPPPGAGPLDPQVLNDSLDELDKTIDEMFAEFDEEGS